MNVDIYKISNSKIICRVLPFFARGRKIILFLEAVASPLIKLHKAFLRWAFDMIIKLKITSQTAILIWYLNHKFGHLFQNNVDSFEIQQDGELQYLVVFNRSETAAIEIFGSRVLNVDESDKVEFLSKPVKPIDMCVLTSAITIKAPAIITNEIYTNREYMTDIKKVIDEYKTSFVQYLIVVNN